MSTSSNHVFETALLLSDAERADLAYQLLQSLVPPGDEVTAEEFGTELHKRAEAHRRGELPSFTLEETRALVKQRLSEGRQ